MSDARKPWTDVAGVEKPLRLPSKWAIVVAITMVAFLGADRVIAQREATEQLDAAAQFALGEKYATGDGLPKDDAQAVQWWRRAAEQGHVDAELRLGEAYADGQ